MCLFRFLNTPLGGGGNTGVCPGRQIPSRRHCELWKPLLTTQPVFEYNNYRLGIVVCMSVCVSVCLCSPWVIRRCCASCSCWVWRRSVWPRLRSVTAAPLRTATSSRNNGILCLTTWSTPPNSRSNSERFYFSSTHDPVVLN